MSVDAEGLSPKTGHKPQKNGLRAVPTRVLSPWSDSNELITVFNSIYQNNDLNGFDLDYNLLTFAKNKIIIWLTRLRHNIDITVHLMATKEIVNALIEDNSNHRTRDDGVEEEEDRDESAVYSLYCLSVIRFCTSISQYSHENNMKSVRRLAHRYSCPQWVIDFRHNLCHSSGNQPSIDELRNAALIGLNWLRQYFWLKILDNTNNAYNNCCNFYELINSYISIDNKNKKKTKNEIISAIKYSRNELITALIQHLISKENINEKKFNSEHLAMSWFSTIVRTIGSDNKESKFKRNFKCISYKTLMPRIDWVRLLYSVVKRPNPKTSALIELIAPIVADVIPEEKIEVLKNLSNRFSYETIESIHQNNEPKDAKFIPKTVKDLSPVVQINDPPVPHMSEPNDWSQIAFGSSLSATDSHDLVNYD
ncbi:unnamed protein product [Medioppia subpectinata]|uniref:Las1-like protein n=1 Tax=Medioppia subpectinata TaxID=1979941 RepID=A0A7R9KIQ3_9ACAR|nr:unnamed protein product [Medioppia subpectinata]CAG2103068.1 unnamed protein product [Medioppia subpectinata]